MTIAFIISAVIAGILFFLWISQKEELEKAEVQIKHLNGSLQEKMKHDTSRDDFRWRTVLKQYMIDDIIRDNGFIPHHGEDDWIYFKKLGETYVLSAHSLPHVQFYKGFDCDDYDIELLKQAAQIAMNEIWIGRITFSEEDTKVAYRVFGVEKSQAHFSQSFMVYMGMLDDLVACHRYYYEKLLEEKKAIKIDDQHIKCIETQNATKILS